MKTEKVGKKSLILELDIQSTRKLFGDFDSDSRVMGSSTAT